MNNPAGYGHQAAHNLGLSIMTPAEVAREKVLAALDTIMKFDTDHQFVVVARRRYLDMTNGLKSANEDQRVATEPAAIVMKHTGIKI